MNQATSIKTSNNACTSVTTKLNIWLRAALSFLISDCPLFTQTLKGGIFQQWCRRSICCHVTVEKIQQPVFFGLVPINVVLEYSWINKAHKIPTKHPISGILKWNKIPWSEPGWLDARTARLWPPLGEQRWRIFPRNAQTERQTCWRSLPDTFGWGTIYPRRGVLLSLAPT